MRAEERHQAILREVRARGSIRVTEFAEQIGVSPITIRRDVETLSNRGLLARVHGGAMLPESATAPADSKQLVLGMVVPSATYYYPQVVRGAHQAAAARGARLTVRISSYDAEEDRSQAGQLLASGIDGLLIAPFGGPAEQEWLTDLKVPVVLVERRAVAGELEHVISDHVHGARIAVRHLAALEHERIGLLISHETPTAPWLTEGFQLGLADAGLDPSWIPPMPQVAGKDWGGFSDQQAEAIAELVARGELTAALVHTDYDATMLSQRLRMGGLRVPEDLAIVAYDDEIAALADVPLTAVAPQKSAVGASAVDVLIRRLSDPHCPRQRLALLPELLVRESCGGSAVPLVGPRPDNAGRQGLGDPVRRPTPNLLVQQGVL
ncbi:substrate-binding domain-containing protein [Micromonospora sp. LZ34]